MKRIARKDLKTGEHYWVRVRTPPYDGWHFTIGQWRASHAEFDTVGSDCAIQLDDKTFEVEVIAHIQKPAETD